MSRLSRKMRRRDIALGIRPPDPKKPTFAAVSQAIADKYDVPATQLIDWLTIAGFNQAPVIVRADVYDDLASLQFKTDRIARGTPHGPIDQSHLRMRVFGERR